MMQLDKMQTLSNQIDKLIDNSFQFDPFSYTEINRADIRKLCSAVVSLTLKEFLTNNILMEDTK